MNKSYKSVWNESTGSWVAVSELATGRSKSKRAKTAISKAILAQVAVGGMSLAGAGAAMAADTAILGNGAASNISDGVAIGVDSLVDVDTKAPTKIGGMAIGDSAYAMGSGIAIGANSQASTDSFAFGPNAIAGGGGTSVGANSYTINDGGLALGKNASAVGAGAIALGMNSSASGSGSLALGQGSVTTASNTVSVGNATLQRKIVNLAAGTTTTDAVNLGQLTAAGLNVDTNGKATNSFVAYDTTAMGKVTLGGGTAGTTITNVKAGTTTTDAVNLGQLTAAGITVDTNGKATNAFVAYDSTAKTGVTLGAGTAGAQIHNLVAGTTATDAVNLGQLTAAGLTVDTAGKATNAFVAYDTTAKAKVTLGGGTAGTTLSNVKAGTTATDAVNLGQLTAAGITVDTNGKATNAFVAYDSTAKNSVTLGGGTAGTTITNLKAGIANSDAVAVSQLKSAGFALDASGNVTTPAVVYTAGSIASGKPNVTLNAGTGNSPYFKNGDRKQGLLPVGTVISNVANGIQDTDAASVGQVNDIVNQTGGSAPSLLQGGLLQATSTGSGVVTTGLGTSYKTAAYYSQVAGMGDATGSTPPSDVARAEGLASIAVGSNAYAKGASSTAVGVQAYTSAADAVALGSGSVANTANTVSIGNDGTGSYTAYNAQGVAYTIKNQANTRRLVNMAAGIAATDAVNVGQLTAAGLAVDTAGNVTNSFVAYDSTAMGKVTLGGGTAGTTITNVKAGTSATDAVNLAQLTAATAGTGATKYFNANSTGGAANATGADAVAIGQTASAAGTSSVAVGLSSKTTVDSGNPTLTGGIAIGNISSATGNGVTVGQNSASASNGAAIGERAWAKVINSTAVGQNATASGASSVALGQGTTASGSSSVALGQGSLATRDNSVSVGTATAQRQIVNLAAGTSATDAVNLGQLTAAGLTVDTAGKATNSFVAYDSTAMGKVTLGGGTAGTTLANVKAGTTTTDAVNLGQLTAAGITFDTTGKATNAFVAYDSTAKTGVTLGAGTAGAQIHNLVAGTTATDAVNLGQLTAAGLTVDTAGKATNAFVAYDTTAKAKVTLGGGTAGTTITNVKAGASSATSTDAVNGSQLFAVQTDINALKNAPAASNPYVSIGALANNAGPATTAVAGDIAIGVRANAAGSGSMQAIAMGTDSSAVGVQSMAIGQGAAASLNGDTAIGTNSVATGGGSYSSATALGYASSATGSLSSALGRGASATGASSVALGANSVADQDKTVSVGSSSLKRKIVNVAAGTSTNDAVNFGQLTAAGLTVDTNGNATNSFVAYDTTAKAKITLGGGTAGTTITNVKAGTTATDAVNLGQLTAAGLNVDTNGKATNSFVAYDTTAMGKVTLGGGTAGTTLSNVKAGTTATDAVNLGQLTAAGITVDTNGKATNAFVAYDSTAKNSVTLGGGTAGTTITNLKAGIANSDAVAVSQLKSAGFTLDASGNVTTPAVVYTAGSIASGKPNVTLNAGTGNSPYFKNGDRKQGLLPVGTVISNVANGIQDTDAASVGQVNDIVNQTGSASPQMVQGVHLLQATSGSGVVTTGLALS